MPSNSKHTASSPQEDQMWLDWLAAAPQLYDEIWYRSNSVVSFVGRKGHSLLERPYMKKDHFGKVLEVGVGIGQHLEYVRHGFDEYHVTDVDEAMVERAKDTLGGRPGLTFQAEDAACLSYPDGHFDRLISIYNLEHITSPHMVLKEWKRVVRKGGVISLVIPAEGGIAWRLGRYLTTRRAMAREGFDHDYIIARDHVNTCYQLVSFIHHYFPQRKEYWYPMRLPMVDINLVYLCWLVVE